MWKIIQYSLNFLTPVLGNQGRGNKAHCMYLSIYTHREKTAHLLSAQRVSNWLLVNQSNSQFMSNIPKTTEQTMHKIRLYKIGDSPHSKTTCWFSRATIDQFRAEGGKEREKLTKKKGEYTIRHTLSGYLDYQVLAGKWVISKYICYAYLTMVTCFI